MNEGEAADRGRISKYTSGASLKVRALAKSFPQFILRGQVRDIENIQSVLTQPRFGPITFLNEVHLLITPTTTSAPGSAEPLKLFDAGGLPVGLGRRENGRGDGSGKNDRAFVRIERTPGCNATCLETRALKPIQKRLRFGLGKEAPPQAAEWKHERHDERSWWNRQMASRQPNSLILPSWPRRSGYTANVRYGARADIHWIAHTR